MLQIETSVLIRRPIQTVITFVANTQNIPRWQIGLPRLDCVSETTIIETGEQLGIKSASGPFEFDTAYHFETVKDGTQITWTCHLRTSEPYRFVEALIGQAMVMATEVSFTILKKLLEEESP